MDSSSTGRAFFIVEIAHDSYLVCEALAGPHPASNFPELGGQLRSSDAPWMRALRIDRSDEVVAEVQMLARDQVNNND